MSDTYRRAFDTAFEVHKGLIHKLAHKGYGRLMQAGVTVDYDDVFQEMSVTYVKAASKYNPEKGVTFTAYLGQAIWNEFNKFAEKEVNFILQVSSIESMSGNADMEGADLYESIDSGIASPEEYMEVKQNYIANTAKCSKNGRLIVKQIINPTSGLLDHLRAKQQAAMQDRASGKNKRAHAPLDVSVALIADYHKMSAHDLRVAKTNLNTVYGTCF